MILRARFLLPVSGPPIENGAVIIEGGRVQALGSWPELAAVGQPVLDLGASILMPGLVNAHCHLDYTDMAGELLPTRSFADWIKSINVLKSTRSTEDYGRSWLRGARMLLEHGVTTVADMEAVPEILPRVSGLTPLRVLSYLELIGIREENAAMRTLSATIDKLERDPRTPPLFGLSPHAPYSTTPELLRQALELAAGKRWRLTTHLAESSEEFDMYARRQGPLYDWLSSQRDMSDCGHGSPIQYLARHQALPDNLLAVHVNYLADGDAEILGGHQVRVVHCPRSHGYFQHTAFPVAALRANRVPLCLGTDSLATVLPSRSTNAELDLFAEMRVLCESQPKLSPEDIVHMATINGAGALGLEGKAGLIAPGAWADLIAIPCAGERSDLYEQVVHHEGPIAAGLIAGQFFRVPTDLDLPSCIPRWSSPVRAHA